jgi:hypothetical protein
VSPLQLWHWDFNNWHGPIYRTDTADIWNPATQAMIRKTVEYRDCGCVLWKEHDHA